MGYASAARLLDVQRRRWREPRRDCRTRAHERQRAVPPGLVRYEGGSTWARRRPPNGQPILGFGSPCSGVLRSCSGPTSPLRGDAARRHISPARSGSIACVSWCSSRAASGRSSMLRGWPCYLTQVTPSKEAATDCNCLHSCLGSLTLTGLFAACGGSAVKSPSAIAFESPARSVMPSVAVFTDADWSGLQLGCEAAARRNVPAERAADVTGSKQWTVQAGIRDGSTVSSRSAA